MARIRSQIEFGPYLFQDSGLGVWFGNALKPLVFRPANKNFLLAGSRFCYVGFGSCPSWALTYS